ncbi:MAG TPA: hypothetical protein VHS55_05235 [Solirubrobacteraceae bacterium]|jgi:hypothetical protein|nr:hypothetical protein [Solirubrobacteraceae bacterium]
MNVVRVGPATIVGYLLSAIAGGGAAIAAAEHELSGPGKWLAIISAVSAIATNLGRQLQAARPTAAPTSPDTSRIPDGYSPAAPPGI